ncbi:DsbC family protein [Roseateles sp. BYS180W]|uniref:Thiol:disulfide interchange protein n=1 Tax=Roseateles rivi TaxID=3299028 RepID=A0ABW7FSD4_9BURK
MLQSVLTHASRRWLGLGLLACASAGSWANEGAIRKSMGERLPPNIKIDEVRPSGVPGLWELRIGNELRYTDATGQYLIEGEVFDLKARRNLTQDRLTRINMIDFASLPLKDAIVWKNGNGKRRIAVFADPNCGYCKLFERNLQDVKDVTVYTFVVAILGGDSPEKARSAWCAKNPTQAWRDWMLDGKTLPKPSGQCDDDAIERNQALIRRHHIGSTPSVIFEDGTRVPGALSAAQVEQRLNQTKP